MNVGEIEENPFRHKPPCCKCKKPSPRKTKKKRKNYELPQEPDVITSYEPCVHLHFKTDTVDRDCLTHEQYSDLLATPKGYRWLGDVDCENAGLEISKNRKKKPKRKESVIVRQDFGDFADEFVEDMWDVMSPSVTDRLIEFLVNEFGMSLEEAEDFIDCKSAVGKQTVCRKKKSKAIISLGSKHKWVKEFSDVFAKRIEQYIVSMLLTRRTPRVKRIAERILEYLCDLTGEKTTLQNPKTKVQRTMVLVADRLALWIEDLMRDIDKPQKKRPAVIEEEEVPESEKEEEGEEEEQEEKPQEEKEPPKEKEEAREEDEKVDTKEEPEEVEAQEPDNVEEDEQQQQGEKQPQQEEKQPQLEEKQPQQEKQPKEEEKQPKKEEKEPEKEEEQEPRKEETQKEKEDEKEPEKAQEREPEKEETPVEDTTGPEEQVDEKEEEPQQTEETAKEKPGEGDEAPTEETTPGEEKTPVGEQPADEEIVSEGKPQEETDEEKPSEVAEEQVDKEPSEAKEKEESFGREQEKKPYDIFDLVKDDIVNIQKDKKTDRQKTVKKVIDRRIEKLMAGIESFDGIQQEDIDDASSRVAHWIETVLVTQEQGKTVPRKGPGAAFKVKPKTGSTLEVKKLSSDTVAKVTAEARGVEAPPRQRKIPASASPMNMQSAQEWVTWATNIASLADNWGKWLDSRLTDAEKQIADRKNEVPQSNWRQRRDQTQHEAQKWRVEKERIKDEGIIWDQKLNENLKTQSETEVRSTEFSS